jgi:hypothetical protein
MTFAGVTHSIHLHFPDTLSTGAADVYDTFIIPEGHVSELHTFPSDDRRKNSTDWRQIHSSHESIDGRPPAKITTPPTHGVIRLSTNHMGVKWVNRPSVGSSVIGATPGHSVSRSGWAMKRWQDHLRNISPGIWSLECRNYGITDAAMTSISL